MKRLAEFVKQKRKEAGLTQEDFTGRAGVALTVIRKIEQGKSNLNLEKTNHVLKMFGHELAPVSSKELRRTGEQWRMTYRKCFKHPEGESADTSIGILIVCRA